MNLIKQWWNNRLPKSVKFVFLVLLANGLPAYIILMSLPNYTEYLFVWTITPEINARLVGVMYSNALLLVVFGALQTSWPRVRITMVVITLFSVFATLLTFFFLGPFLAHPWYHLAYWLTMYFVLFFSAPVIFFIQERKNGGRLPVLLPMGWPARLVAIGSMLFSFVVSLLLLFSVGTVNRFLPWDMTPLVGGLIGVLLITHAAAYAWALLDGDWLRVRPIFWQAPITALLFLLLPFVHYGDLKPGSGISLVGYVLITAFFGLVHSGVVVAGFFKERKPGVGA